MAFDWNSLKKNVASNVLNQNSKNEDERFWKLGKDADGNGNAVIRLLPGKNNTPSMIRVYKHSIFLKVQDKWRIYNNISPLTIDRNCPVADVYYELKEAAKNDKSLEEIAQKVGRKTSFYTNCKIVNDLTNAENNGKVKIFEYGSSIFNQLMEQLEPNKQQIDLGVKPKALFDPINGNNIVVGRTGKGLNTTYTIKSQDPSPICTEAEVDELVNSGYDLNEFIKPENIKTYDQLKQEFAKTIRGTVIEDALLKIGSKVITKRYDENDTTETNTVSNPASNSAIPSIPGVQQSQTPVTEPVQNTVPVTEPVTETPSVTNSNDDLDALLAGM